MICPVMTISPQCGQCFGRLNTSALAIGQHNITGQYQGDNNYSAATSNAVVVNVEPSTPPLTVVPAKLLFGGHTLGDRRSAKRVRLINKTGVTVTLSSWTLTGADSGDFQVEDTTCGTSLSARASCTISVVFAPQTIGMRP